MICVRTRLLRPSWLVMHVLVVVALYAMFRLGVWQWGRGHQTGSIRNYSYGLEWWAFVVLTLAGWVKFCVDESRPAESEAAPAAEPAPAAVAVREGPPADEDPDLAAWNARFAELARRDAETSS
jgi:DNA-binding transcriptional regulator of glucitol operon